MSRKLATCHKDVGRVADVLRGHYEEVSDLSDVSGRVASMLRGC